MERIRKVIAWAVLAWAILEKVSRLPGGAHLGPWTIDPYFISTFQNLLLCLAIGFVVYVHRELLAFVLTWRERKKAERKALSEGIRRAKAATRDAHMALDGSVDYGTSTWLYMESQLTAIGIEFGRINPDDFAREGDSPLRTCFALVLPGGVVWARRRRAELRSNRK